MLLSINEIRVFCLILGFQIIKTRPNAGRVFLFSPNFEE